MLGQRKKLKGEINHISRLIDLYIYKKDFIASKSTQDECHATLEYLKSVLKQAQNDYDAMPSGHRYTGTLYVRKVNYDNTVDRVKINGSAFIREDLVSWRITSDHEYAQNLYYIRDVYKDKNFKEPIKREDCEPVFEPEYENK